jgi:DNA polymerase-3 subunit epsilon
MREIVFDTETTGLDPLNGDRVVEIGCVELLNRIPTGNSFHAYINPERDMPRGAFEIHGLSSEFLRDKPLFAAISADFLEFIGDATLIAHNALFDMRFINAEFERLGMAPISHERVVDTLLLARKKCPGMQNSLDALCKRFNIDNSRRVNHGALLDSELLAEVYVELTGGRQVVLDLAVSVTAETGLAAPAPRRIEPPRPHAPSAAEEAAHQAFIAGIAGNFWTIS